MQKIFRTHGLSNRGRMGDGMLPARVATAVAASGSGRKSKKRKKNKVRNHCVNRESNMGKNGMGHGGQKA